MLKTKLNEKDKELYNKIIVVGTTEDMFNFGYTTGQSDLLKEQIEKLEK